MMNVLTSSVADTETKCPEYKVVAVDIRKARKVEQRAAASQSLAGRKS
jgi:formate dehydrogenase major subunit